MSESPPGLTRQDFARLDKELQFWSEHREKYEREFPDEFVAVKDGQVLAHDDDLVRLCAALKSIGVRPRDVYMRFMATKPFLIQHP